MTGKENTINEVIESSKHNLLKFRNKNVKILSDIQVVNILESLR